MKETRVTDHWQEVARRVMRLHHETKYGPYGPICTECGDSWPCATQRILHSEDVQRVPATESGGDR